MAYDPTPKTNVGGERSAIVTDRNVIQLLEAILAELRTLNEHAELVTDVTDFKGDAK